MTKEILQKYFDLNNIDGLITYNSESLFDMVLYNINNSHDSTIFIDRRISDYLKNINNFMNKGYSILKAKEHSIQPYLFVENDYFYFTYSCSKNDDTNYKKGTKLYHKDYVLFDKDHIYKTLRDNKLESILNED